MRLNDPVMAHLADRRLINKIVLMNDHIARLDLNAYNEEEVPGRMTASTSTNWLYNQGLDTSTDMLLGHHVRWWLERVRTEIFHRPPERRHEAAEAILTALVQENNALLRTDEGIR